MGFLGGSIERGMDVLRPTTKGEARTERVAAGIKLRLCERSSAADCRSVAGPGWPIFLALTAALQHTAAHCSKCEPGDTRIKLFEEAACEGNFLFPRRTASILIF